MVEVIKYGPGVQKEITCSKCKSKLRFLNGDIQSIDDICPWDDTHGYWAKYIKCPACGEKVIIWGKELLIMTNNKMTNLWELCTGVSDLKNTCKKRCKTCRYSNSFGFIRAEWPCITCYGNPIYPHLDYPDHYEELTNFEK